MSWRRNVEIKLRQKNKILDWLYVDRARWHRGEEVDLFVQAHTRLRLEYLPLYQPGLNLQERIWRQVRYEATANRWFDNLDLIWDTVQKTTQA